VDSEESPSKDRTTLLANISHELRTPMTNLKTRLYLLRNQPARLLEHVGIMESVVNWMGSLVDDFLDYSRFEHGRIPLDRQPVVAQDILSQTVLMQESEATQKYIQLTLDMPSAPVHVNADAHRLMQVVTNLVINAIHYTPEGGEVTVRLITQNGHSLIQVADTGIGISPEHLERIFEPFFRVNEAKVRGTGLGLAISRAIIEAHQGSLAVESVPGKGSVFSILLKTDATNDANAS